MVGTKCAEQRIIMAIKHMYVFENHAPFFHCLLCGWLNCRSQNYFFGINYSFIFMNESVCLALDPM